MNRREFSAGAACVLGVAALGLPGVVFGQVKKPEDGVEYQILSKPVQVEAPPGKIEVIEFFWYACPHCNAFEPKLEAWIRKQPADVFVKRVPVAFRDSFVPQQKLFYTLEAMGKLDTLHVKVFNAIHGAQGAQVERSALNREDEIADWVAKQGLDRAKFVEMYNSFGVSSKARRAAQLQQAFGVSGVPSIGIAGRWYTDGDLARNMDRALQVTDYLVAEARKAK